MSTRGSTGAWREKGREKRAGKAVGLTELAPWPGVLQCRPAVADALARPGAGHQMAPGWYPECACSFYRSPYSLKPGWSLRKSVVSLQRCRSWCSGLGGSLQTARPVGSPVWLCCSRNGVSYHIATPRVWVASSVLQQGNHLHQTGFLAAAAVPLCQLQCVGWHIAEMRGVGEGREAEPWLRCARSARPRPLAGPGSASTSLCGDTKQLSVS